MSIPSQSPVHLQFSKAGKFRILAIGDPHEKYVFDDKTEDAMRLLDASASALKPDLVIFMGDFVQRYPDEGGEYLRDDQIMEQIERLTGHFTTRGIPVGLVFGNHDGEPPEDKDLVFRLMQQVPQFINTDESGASGVGNCFVPIYDRKGEKMLFNLWLIDSGSGAQDGGGGYAWVEQDQIDWYERTCDAITAQNGGKVVPSIVFQHIPVCEEYDLLRETSILNPNRVAGQGMFAHKFYVKGDNVRGYLGEGPCCPARNSGQFASWKKKGDVIAAIFGHDHMNRFEGETQGILLCQTQCSGFHMWGDGLRQGVRVIDLDETRPGDLTTYMVYYRDFFGTDCKSISRYNLLSDRWHINFKVTLAVLGVSAGAAALAVGAKKLAKRCRKK